MKKLFIPLLFSFAMSILHKTPDNKVDPSTLFSSLENGMNALRIEKQHKKELIFKTIKNCEDRLVDPSQDMASRFDCMLMIRSLEQQSDLVDLDYDLKFTRFRYKKGVEILKMVYEKILSLDHHFSTLRSFQDIIDLSNPNSYPEFVKIKESLKSNTKSKDQIQLPSFLDNNPLISMGYTVVSSFFGTGNRAQRTKELEDISCLLDFTLSMQSDLKIIYYETDFLKIYNLDLRDECLKLFKDYTKVINYGYSLEFCRENDDWDDIFQKLESLISELESHTAGRRPFDPVGHNMQLNNLKFSVDRLLSFMDSYSDFIFMGEKYYQKFLAIIQNYNNIKICSPALPKQYAELESEIKLSIKKFETAYKIAELKGTKLRDLLYGIPDS